MDLFVLTADADTSATMKELLRRATDLGIRRIEFRVDRHLQRDAGCRVRASQWLRPHILDYAYALVLFDLHGCGSQAPREEIQAEVEHDLRRNGWPERSKVIVIEPELEAWVWTGTESAARVLGWEEHQDLREWLRGRRLWPARLAKPPRPKDAMKSVLEFKQIRHSPRIFEDLASAVEFDMCADPAFGELRETLARWFPA